MKIYTYSDARQKFSSVLEQAQKEGKVLIKRRDGRIFSLTPEKSKNEKSPFDIKGVKTKVTTEDIISTISDERGRTRRWS